MRSTRGLWVVVCAALLCIAFAGVSPAAAGVLCQGPADCNDGDECTQNQCVNGACVFPVRPLGTACADDGNDCTRDLCLAGPEGVSCQHVSAPIGSQCGDDGNDCTRDLCQPGPTGIAVCIHPDAPIGSACGDDGNECTQDQCQPGPAGSVCQHFDVPTGSPCRSDDNDCTLDLCNFGPTGSMCAHHPLPQGSTCEDDGSECTYDSCEPGPNGPFCRHAALQQGSTCDDGSPCTQFDACDQLGACVGTSAVLDCRAATKASLLIKNGERNSRDLIDFKWLRGTATDVSELGDPTTTTDYTLCIFDGSGLLRMSASVPAGGQCGDEPCWRPSGRGYAYRDVLRLADGIGKVRLGPGAAQKSSVQVRGKGSFLPVPALPLSGQVLVQVINDANGVCFQSQFATAASNTATKYQAQTP